MSLEEIRHLSIKLNQIAAKHGISKIYLFGSMARGEDVETSDIDFLVEMQPGASVLGIGGFQYEAEKLLGVKVDVVPTFALSSQEDQGFAQRVQHEAIAL
jgi:hypothetical protein